MSELISSTQVNGDPNDVIIIQRLLNLDELIGEHLLLLTRLPERGVIAIQEDGRSPPVRVLIGLVRLLCLTSLPRVKSCEAHKDLL